MNSWRDELLHAKYHLGVVMRHELLFQLLEWRVEVDRGWVWKPGTVGWGLKGLFTHETWSALEATWVENCAELTTPLALRIRIRGLGVDNFVQRALREVVNGCSLARRRSVVARQRRSSPQIASATGSAY